MLSASRTVEIFQLQPGPQCFAAGEIIFKEGEKGKGSSRDTCKIVQDGSETYTGRGIWNSAFKTEAELCCFPT
jgi:hypothetical protein